MERWHYSKWKLMVPEESRSDFERFFSGRGFTVKRWVNYEPDIDGDPDLSEVQNLAEKWAKSSNRVRVGVGSPRVQEIATTEYTPINVNKMTPVDESAPVKTPKKRPKRSKSKGGA